MTEPHRAPTAAPTPAPTGAGGIRGARRTAVVLIVASLSLTAVVGIITLLSGDFGPIQGKTMLTTLVIGVGSLTALCHLAVLGRPVRIVGFVGLAASAIALVLGLTAIWIDWGTSGELLAELVRWFAIVGIVALSIAHASLLLLLATRRRTAVRVSLAVTLAAIAVVASMLFVPILTDFEVPGANDDTYWRVFGVIAIIDALGTVVVPIIALFLRDDEPVAAAGPTPSATPDATGIEQRIAALSATTGLDRDRLLTAALDVFEAGIVGAPRD